ncbi:MAG TPA: helix-turn-helix domain-containing protein [Gemmatimonadaceae bacterium]|nr:helix-turn-helix domain-containing protein [Gemmatimonadaceae bacterium]
MTERQLVGSAAADARVRIVDAGARCIAREGVAGASMAAIALEAGVSKALLHYHYRDRAALLAEIVERVGVRVIGRERAAIDRPEAVSGLDALWGWLDDELRRGELASVAALALVREGPVRDASRNIADHRRRSATRTVERMFAELELTPRLPAALMADASVVFTDGLALDVASGSARDPRVSFDIFWLGLLGLTE